MSILTRNIRCQQHTVLTHSPDHHVDGCDHVVPLGDEAVEDVTVEYGSKDSNGGEERPPGGELVLALLVSRPGYVIRVAGLGDGPGEKEDEEEYHQPMSPLHRLV